MRVDIEIENQNEPYRMEGGLPLECPIQSGNYSISDKCTRSLVCGHTDTLTHTPNKTLQFEIFNYSNLT